MREFSRVGSRVAGRGSLGSEPETASTVRSPRLPGRIATLAVALILGVAGSTAAVAQELNRIWAGCVLTPGAVDELEASVDTSSAIGTPEIAFVVVYSLNHDNDGQPVTVQGQSGSTGAVICRNTAVVAAPVATSQTTDIGSNNVTILDAEEAFIVRYQIGSTIEKRVCHTVNQNTDCYRISP